MQQILDLLHLFAMDPAASAKTGLRFVHFIGLAIGLGGATLLDLLLLRFCVRRNVSQDTYSVFDFTSKIVDFGLKVLWITGAGFLFHYALFAPDMLGNPKVHAKLVVVAILTLNGMVIHTFILPHLRNQIGKPLFADVGPLRRSIFLVSGAISVVSWYSPVALGAFSQLNFSVSATTLLTIYLMLVVVAALAMFGLVALLQPRDDPQTGAAPFPTERPSEPFPSRFSILRVSPEEGSPEKRRIPARRKQSVRA